MIFEEILDKNSTLQIPNLKISSSPAARSDTNEVHKALTPIFSQNISLKTAPKSASEADLAYKYWVPEDVAKSVTNRSHALAMRGSFSKSSNAAMLEVAILANNSFSNGCDKTNPLNSPTVCFERVNAKAMVSSSISNPFRLSATKAVNSCDV